MLRKSLLFTFAVILFLSGVASAGYDWKYVTYKSGMVTGDSFQAGEYKAVLSDYSLNWDGEVTALMFEIYKDGVYDEKIIIPQSETVYFGNDTHRLTFTYPGEIRCSLDSAIIPCWTVSSITTQRSTYNSTVILTRVTDADAKNVKIYFVSSGVNLSSKSSLKRYSVVSKDKNLTNSTIKWSGSGNITMYIEYKDLDGKAHKRTIDILNSTVWKTTSSSTISESRKNAEEEIFKKAVVQSMLYANLTDSQYQDLKAVAHLSGSYNKVTVPEKRYQAEKMRLANSITRVLKYLDFTDAEKEKLNKILGEIKQES